jgi:hypothetical protein
MEGEKKDDGTVDPFKMLLEEALTQQRNYMTDLPRAEASPPSRYKSTSMFLYLKVR